jgi:hypothetical protein
MKRRVCAVLVTAALAGCGTGGGGSGGPNGPVSDSSSPPSSDSSSPPASFEFPTLSTVRGSDVRVSSAITSRDHEHFRDRVTATADGAGNFTVRVNDPNVGAYQFTVNVPPNTFMLALDSAQMEATLTSMTYSAAGVWHSKMHPQLGVRGAGAFGVATGSADLPTTGTAQYSGTFMGHHSDDGDPGRVFAQARSLANFGTGVVSFATTNSTLNAGFGDTPDPRLDLTGSMTGVRTNQLRGTVSNAAGMTGEVRANFFGPASSTSAPPELAGSVAVKQPSAAPGREGRSMIGGFVMKR